jgi:hypothetical protein
MPAPDREAPGKYGVLEDCADAVPTHTNIIVAEIIDVIKLFIFLTSFIEFLSPHDGNGYRAIDVENILHLPLWPPSAYNNRAAGKSTISAFFPATAMGSIVSLSSANTASTALFLKAIFVSEYEPSPLRDSRIHLNS